MYPYSLQFSCGCSKNQFKCEFTYRKKSELCQLNFGKKSVARMMNRASVICHGSQFIKQTVTLRKKLKSNGVDSDERIAFCFVGPASHTWITRQRW